MQVGQTFSPYRIFQGPIIPECLIPYPKISWGAKILLAVMNKYIGRNEDSWPGQDTLAVDMGVSIRSVGGYIAELVDDGFLKVSQRGLGKTNVYKATWHPVFNEPSSDPVRQDSSESTPQRPSDPLHSSYEVNQTSTESFESQEGSSSTSELEEPDFTDYDTALGSIRNKKKLKMTPSKRAGLGEHCPFHVSPSVFDRTMARLSQLAVDGKVNDPIAAFLSSPSKWFDNDRGGEPRVPRPTVPESQHPTPKNALVLLAEWNRTVLLCPCTDFSEALDRITMPREVEFYNQFSEICTVSQAIHEQAPNRDLDWPGPTFRWLFKSKDGMPNWRKVLTELRRMGVPPKTAPVKFKGFNAELWEENERAIQAMEAKRK